jgi:hypothetical protein
MTEAPTRPPQHSTAAQNQGPSSGPWMTLQNLIFPESGLCL